MNIRDYYQHAWFADLAYVEWSEEALSGLETIESSIDEANRARLAPEVVNDQGDAVAPALASKIFLPTQEAWTIADYHPNDPESGFAATLFTRVAAGGTEAVLALRGSEPGAQFGKDLFEASLQQIGGIGLALAQGVSLLNYVERLQAPAGQAVAQFSLVQGIHAPPPGAPVVVGAERSYWLEPAAPRPGLGLLGADTAVTVTGHSLGGHLAALALRLFPQRFDHAVTFNAPGFDPVLGVNDIEGVVAGVAGAIGSSGVFAAAQILAAIVENGQQLSDELVDGLFAPVLPTPPAAQFAPLAAAGRLHSLVAEQSDAYDDVSVVAAPLITGNPASPHLPVATESNSHAMGQLVDALGVQALLERIDPTIDLERAGTLLALAAPRAAVGEENLVMALSRLFLGTALPGLPHAVARGIDAWFASPEPYPARGLLHERLIALENAIGVGGLGTLLAPDALTPAAMAAAAMSDPAWRYALLAQNPFVLTGPAALYEATTAGAAPAPDSLPLWTARAELLERLLLAHRHDTASVAGIPFRIAGANVDWIDELSGARFAAVALDGLAVGLRGTAIDTLRSGAGAVATVRFGAAVDVAGGAADDRLFGNALDNRLLGFAGADALFGGDGDDSLYHHDLGGADDGMRDYLAGGAGYDRYFVGDGDIVADSDGAGELRVGPAHTVLAGSYREVAAGVFRHAILDATLYRRDDGITLVARVDGQTVRITLAPAAGAARGFASGDLGIVLEAATAPPPVVIDGTPGDDRDAFDAALFGSDANERIDGGDGDDDLYGGTRGTAWGSDWLFGGAGDDYLNSATWFDADLPTQFDDPGDFLLGGDGRDVAVGNGGADVLLGGDGADFLSGRGNHDVIDGGAGDDLVSGGGGDDRLFGGDGDDILLGQTDLWGSTARNWSTTWVRDAAGRIVDFAATGVFGAPRGADDADLLRGGGGNDLLDGGDGDDALHGDAGADVLFGGRGADRLDGGPGDDHLYGDGLEAVAVPGDGDDVLDGGDGDDALHGGGGADRLAGGAGDDRLFGGDGADRLAGNVGDDLLEGGGGSDHLQGDDGDDALRGDAGDDVLEGGAGNDGLEGGGGADVLAGGTGDDQLAGGDGHDTYLYYPGDGHDRIVDTAGWDTVILADPGALANAVQRREGADLVLHFSATDSLHLVDWAAGAIERVVAGERVLYADAVTTEPLDPAQPRDGTWVFASASGGLTIPAGDSAHTLVLGRGIEPTDLAGVVGADGTWRATIDGTSLAIGGWESSALSHFRFADGSTLDRYPIELAVRYAPHLAEPLVDRVAVPGYALDFAIPPFAFARGDFGPLQFSASRADGTPLPSWLDFAADGARFTATPAPSSAPGALEIAVTARNMRGDVVRDVFTLDVRGWPFSAPSVLHPLLVDGRRAAWLGPPPADTEHSMPSARGSGVGFAPAAPSPVPRAPSDARGVGDVDGDGYGDFHLRERFVVDGRAEVRDHIVLGRAGGLPVVLDTLAEAAAGRAFEIVGAAPFTAVDSGDVDGDGRSDLLVRSAAGIYNIVYGSAARPAPVALDTLTPAQGYAFTASGMVRVLDLDGDGLADIFTPRAVLRGEAPRRRAGVIDLQGSGFDGEPLITAGAGPGFELAPDAGFDFNRLTDIHAIGDFDGDGYDDFFVVAAPEYGIDPAYHVVRGAGGGVRAGFDLDTAPLITLGGDLSRGGTVTHGDFNGDGLSDLVLVAAAQADARNEQRVVFGTRDTAITHLDTGALDGSNGFIVDGGWDVAGIGSAREGMLAVALGDINGDGIDDLAFSSRTTLDVPTHAYLPVVYGRDTPFPARFDLTALDIDDGFHAMLPFGAHGTLHVQPRALGDVDGDGHADFLVFGDSGSGYLVRGQPALAAVLVNGTPGADHLEVVTAGSFVQAGAGDDVIEVRNPLGVTIDAGSGDDIIRFDGDVARYEVPLGTTPAAWARQQPTFVHTGDGAKLIHLGAAPLALHIVATEDGRGNDLSLGQGYRPALLRLRPGSIKLDFGAQLGEVHLENFDPLDILGGPRSIDRVLFDDGTVLSYEALVARGFDIGGSNGADTLYGTNLVDRISGHGGADVLDARAGDDILRGGRGNDTYLVRRGEGSDLVYDVGGTDTVQFLDGITLADLSVQRLAKDLHIAIAGGGELRVRGQFSTPSLAVERLAFDDGSRWDVRTLTNSPPFVFRPPAPLPVDPGLPFEHRLPPLTFLDREADRLTYTLTDAGGGAPPGWLTFDPVLRILRGTLPHEQSHDVELVLGADDGLARTDTRLVLDVGVPPADLAPPIVMAPPLIGTPLADTPLASASAGDDARLLVDAMAAFAPVAPLDAAFAAAPPEASLPPLAVDWSHAA